jgi:Na+/H+ antiporter NhaD/arsenite permease-like protein
MIAPFVVLLGITALAPVWLPRWWTRHYGKVALGLGATTVAYYAFFLPPRAIQTVGETAADYFGFMALIGSLYVVSGGIHIQVEGRAGPRANVLFLAAGALLANVAGNVGASMLLIRPWLRFNRHRAGAHHVVFFIFIICNVGGCLIPMGPPLFLGFLKGVPFWWVAGHCWAEWAVAMAFLLAVFFVIDRGNYRCGPDPAGSARENYGRWSVEGLGNVVFLAIIVGSIFISGPRFLREGLMLSAAAGSYFTTRQAVHRSNEFNFDPVIEVAVLFLGIFATMMPALDWLKSSAPTVVGANPPAALFYWWSGTVSSVLDNAPAYLSFLAAMIGSCIDPATINQVNDLLRHGAAALPGVSENVRQSAAAVHQYFPAQWAAGKVEQIQMACLLADPRLAPRLAALSVASVFFGGNTYIGNGPNLMVKSIADRSNAPSPTFLGYVFKWTVPVMLPLLILEWLIFFR